MSKYSFTVLVLLFLLYSCGKKHVPTTVVAETPETIPVVTEKKTTPPPVKKKAFTPTKKDIIPPSIVINDQAAKKAVDGRLYYDLLGNRYWKNYKDGKYYLFNQSMYDNPAFKPPGK